MPGAVRVRWTRGGPPGVTVRVRRARVYRGRVRKPPPTPSRPVVRVLPRRGATGGHRPRHLRGLRRSRRGARFRGRPGRRVRLLRRRGQRRSVGRRPVGFGTVVGVARSVLREWVGLGAVSVGSVPSGGTWRAVRHRVSVGRWLPATVHRRLRGREVTAGISTASLRCSGPLALLLLVWIRMSSLRCSGRWAPVLLGTVLRRLRCREAAAPILTANLRCSHP